jgi:hypothetical protein
MMMDLELAQLQESVLEFWASPAVRRNFQAGFTDSGKLQVQGQQIAKPLRIPNAIPNHSAFW